MSTSNDCAIHQTSWIGVLILSSVVAIGASGQESGEPPAKPTATAASDQILSTLDDGATANLFLGTRLAQRPQLSEYWLGVDGIPADETLRAQLELPDGQGLVLNQVVENSPAAKAGLKQHDVLLTAGDKPLTQTSALAAVIAEKKGRPFPIKLFRRGRQIIIEVKADRRPASETGETCPGISRENDAEFIHLVYLDLLGKVPSWEEGYKFQEDKQADKRVRLVNWLLRASTAAKKSCTSCHAPTDNSTAQLLERVLINAELRLHPFENLDIKVLEPVNAPTVVLEPSTTAPQAVNPTPDMLIDNAAPDTPLELPDDLTIIVTRTGKQPAKISVKRAEQSWETSGDKLDQLPDDVRGYVEKLLWVKHSRATNKLRYWMLDTGRSHPVDITAWQARVLAAEAATSPAVPSPTAAVERLDQQLDKLKAEFDEVRKAVQELRKTLPAETPKRDGSEKK